MNRENVITIISEPKNEDVILYNTTLVDLLDVNVFQEYRSTLNLYKLKKEKYLLLDKEVKQYQEMIDGIYLYRKDWKEEDYVEMLKKDKQQYSKLYSDIKKMENQIQVLEKKFETTNQQIEIQKVKDAKEIEEKKKNIDAENSLLANNISKMNLEIKELERDLKLVNEEIEEKNEEKEAILEMASMLNDNAYVCQYCGTTITHSSSKQRIGRTLQKNLDKNQNKIEILENKKNNIEKDLAYIRNELSKNKIELKNNIEFKKQDYNFYIKKSIPVLKLEAIRDNILTQLTELKTKYEKNPQVQQESFKILKDRMEKYELSLNNIRKINTQKEDFKSNLNTLKTLKEEILNLREKLNKYIKFINIYYKIYQQKIGDYFGSDFSFTFHKFEDYDLHEIFELKYKNISFTQLPKTLKKECEDIYYEKIKYFSKNY